MSVAILLVMTLLLLLPNVNHAAAGGRIFGTVNDPTGAVVAKAVVTATNTETGVQQTVVTNDTGTFSFPSLPVGHYNLDITAAGFRPYRRTAITLDVNSSLLVDAVLEVGGTKETVTVEESVVQAETSSTQLGEVISGKSIAALPLNGRSYTDLLALQPGVVPATTITALTVQGLGQSVFSPSGDLNPGTLSIHGQRESANGYMVNGADAEETGSMAAAIIPNLDSIAEFRILSDNFDAEYGRYTGGQINVITKSGANKFHGNAFEFLRNTDLDARNYFSPARGTFIQNQFGGTLGGPIVRKKVFFFTDYQGTRQIQGTDSGLISVPSMQDRTGDLSDQGSSFATTATANGQQVQEPTTVSGFYFANLLSQKLNYAVTPGEPYYFMAGETNPLMPGTVYATNCTSSAQCVLPNATIPQSAWSAPAPNLLKYIPEPNLPNNEFSTSAYNQILKDDKIGERVDADTRWGMIFGYYSLDNYSLNNPYPTAQGGANVPGFNGLYTGRAQLAILGDTKTIGTSAVNEFRVSYTRDANDFGNPDGGLGVSLASQGFVTGEGTLGIVPLAPENQGVENVFFNNFTIGSVPDEFYQINNDYEVSDVFSKVVRSHSIKFGAQVDYDQIDTHPFADLNGSFNFYGTETGLDFADFLLGIASQYTQNDLRAFYGRNKFVALFVEDSWRLKSNLTFNYGLRWDRIEPWYEKYNNNITFIPGEQSVVFPTAPTGIVYPGDPGVSRTLSPAGNRDFAPRLGLAYSPNARPDSLLAKIIGGPGKTSIRVGYGIFYAAIPGETLGLISDNAPYGFTYTSPAPPLFTTPFVDAATGNSEGQRFPAQLALLNVSPSNPDTAINFSQFEPIGTIPGYKTDNSIPYTEEFMVSLQRQIGTNTLLSIGYVGNQAHHLLVLEAANPGNPALCLSLSQADEVAPGSATCGPFGENGVYTSASGQVINGTRGPLGPAFGSVSYQTTIGNSNYNALEVNLHHTSRRAELFFSYTYSKAIDQASNFGEQVNPIDPSLSRELSSFDMRQNFVASYTYRFPFESLFRARNRWTEGWSISGITRYTTGFPITFYNYADTSLLGTQGNGVNNLAVDSVDYLGLPLDINHNPRNGQPYFNPLAFGLPTLGSVGNASRRSLSGPGINNYDLTVQKNLKLTESKALEMRLEAFNAFNHAQFYGPTAVDGNVNSATFGQIVSAAPPRLVQIAVKVIF
ncbi:MAG: carboxypeptidase regulatory-like domain-containing protein [Candidatus Acidiferrum sp.]